MGLRRKILIAGGSLLTLLAVALGGLFMQYKHYEQAYDRLRAGLTKEQVSASFGPPWQVRNCEGEAIDNGHGISMTNRVSAKKSLSTTRSSVRSSGT